MKKFFAILMAAVLVLAMSTVAIAQGTGSITIENAAKGVTYKIFKLFDATVNADGTSIAYTGDIPEDLKDYFYKNDEGNVFQVEGTSDDAIVTALQTWARNQTATTENTKVGDGGKVVFSGLEFGYYVITTTPGAAIAVDSTNPNPSVYDKNPNTPLSNLSKTVDDEDVFIGQTLTYTIKFQTSNYNGDKKDAQKIVSYTIHDTLPTHLRDVVITECIVDNDGDVQTKNDQSVLTIEKFDDNGNIELQWVEDGKSLYNNGAWVVLTYTAVVDDDAAIAGEGNPNTVTVTWKDAADKSGFATETATVYTYAIALKKVNQDGVALKDATFQLPFYVKSAADDDGAYIYAGTAPAEGLTNTLPTPANGEITIKGVASGEYAITETIAPNGYNKLTAPVVVEAQVTDKTTTHTTFYLDGNGNEVAADQKVSEVKYDNANLAASAVVVVNKTGTELPSTGGIGTTVFYVAGGVLMLAAAVLLVAKKMTSSGR